MGLAAWLALHFSAAVAGTWAARRYALSRHLLDAPGERRSHSVATPRGGGIAIAIPLALALGLLAVEEGPQRPVLLAAAVGSVLVALIGWIDDHAPLSPWLRLLVHALAAALLAAGALASGGGLWIVLVAFGAAAVLTNVWNFMDGIDGIAASQAAIAAAGYACVAGSATTVWLALALAAACCGFLPFNFPRARIFLGDVGSGAVGYGLAVVLVLSMAGSRPASWLLLILPLSAFLVDATLTLGMRILHGEAWWRPHVQHAYQVLARRYGRHWPVTVGYSAWALAAVLGMAVLNDASASVIIASVAAWLVLGTAVWLLAQAARGGRFNRQEHT